MLLCFSCFFFSSVHNSLQFANSNLFQLLYIVVFLLSMS